MSKARNLASSTLNTLSVDDTTLVVDAANNSVGVGTGNPAQALDVVGNIKFGNSTAQPSLYLNNTSTGSWKSELIFANGASPKWASGVDINAAGNNNFYWYDAAAGTERMRIDSGGNLLVGSSSNSLGGKLYVNGRSSSRGSAVVLTPNNGNSENFSELFYTGAFTLASGASVTLWDNTAFYGAQFFDIFIQNDYGPRLTQWFRGNCSGYGGGVTILETNNGDVGTISYQPMTPGSGQCRVIFTNRSTTQTSTIQVWVKMYGTATAGLSVVSSYLTLN